MVVLERLGECFLENGRGSKVTSGGQKEKLGHEATINSKMALPLRVLSPFASFHAPVDGAQLAHSSCPGPEAHTLHCTFVFRPLCGAAGLRTRTRRLGWPRSLPLAQVTEAPAIRAHWTLTHGGGRGPGLWY